MILLRLCLVMLLSIGSVSNMAFANTEASHDGIEITVNINTASAEEIATMLNGIGDKKAQDIVEYREANGSFKSLDELTQVKGIGETTVEKNKQRILL